MTIQFSFNSGASPSPENGSSNRSSPQPPSVAWLRARVKGRVQGVGFRYWTVDEAESLHLTGWVRNCIGGDVELEAEGPRPVLEEFLKRLHEGPTLSRVVHIDVDWGERPRQYNEFFIEHTW